MKTSTLERPAVVAAREAAARETAQSQTMATVAMKKILPSGHGTTTERPHCFQPSFFSEEDLIVAPAQAERTPIAPIVPIKEYDASAEDPQPDAPIQPAEQPAAPMIIGFANIGGMPAITPAEAPAAPVQPAAQATPQAPAEPRKEYAMQNWSAPIRSQSKYDEALAEYLAKPQGHRYPPTEMGTVLICALGCGVVQTQDELVELAKDIYRQSEARNGEGHGDYEEECTFAARSVYENFDWSIWNRNKPQGRSFTPQKTQPRTPSAKEVKAKAADGWAGDMARWFSSVDPGAFAFNTEALKTSGNIIHDWTWGLIPDDTDGYMFIGPYKCATASRCYIDARKAKLDRASTYHPDLDAYAQTWRRVTGMCTHVMPNILAPEISAQLQEQDPNKRRGMRTQKNVLAIRYVLLEWDEDFLGTIDAPKDTAAFFNAMRAEQQELWRRIMAGGFLPVARLTYSGGRSLHALIPVHATNEQWQGAVKKLQLLYTLLGLDVSNIDSARCTRVGGAVRTFVQDKQGILHDPSKDRAEADALLENGGLVVTRIQEPIHMDDGAEPLTIDGYIEALTRLATVIRGADKVDQALHPEKYQQGQATNDGADKLLPCAGPWIRDYIQRAGIEVALNTTIQDIECSHDGHTLTITQAENMIYDAYTEYSNKYGNRENIRKVLAELSEYNAYSSVYRWLNELEWDGVDRLPHVYKVLKCTDPFEQTLIHKWLIQTAARTENSADTQRKPAGVLVLYGAEGGGKTTFFRKLAMGAAHPEYFKESIGINTDNKDDLIRICSGWILELGEADATLARNQAILKGIITAVSMQLRKPYASAAETIYPQTSLCATVNPTNGRGDLLKANAGHRRWWIVNVDCLDFEAESTLDIPQLWAQIWHEWTHRPHVEDGEIYDLTREELAALQQHNTQYKETSGFEELIRGVFDFDAPEDTWREEICINIATVAVNHLSSTNKTPSPLEIKGVQRALSEMGLRTEKRTNRGYLYRIPPKTTTTYYR